MTSTMRRITTPAGDPAWVVTDYDTVRSLLADPRLGLTHPQPELAARLSDSVIFGRPQAPSPTDAVDHTRMRRLLGRWFSARRLSALRPRVQQLVDGLLDQLGAAPPPADFHDAVAFPLPALVICELLGVPYAHRDEFRRWSDNAADMTDKNRSAGGRAALWQYISDLVAAKLDAPGEDLLSDLVDAHRDDPEGFGLDKIADLGAVLLFAGHETTVTAIDTGLVLLATHREQRDALLRKPEMLPGAVEEILRGALPRMDYFETPDETSTAGALPRWANTNLDIAGVTVPAGDLVLLGLAHANLDERVVCGRPGFDVARHPNPHLTFGFGPHFCIGAPLARLELQVLFAAVLDRFPTIALAVPVEDLQPRTNLLTGGLAALPVTW